MPKTTAILHFTFKPDALDEAHKVMRKTLAQTAAFPGCLELQVLVDESDPAHVAIYEVWESEEADAAYRAWRQTPEGATDLGNVLAGAPSMTKYSTFDL